MFWLGAFVSLCYVPGYTGAYIATQWPVLAVVLWLGLLRSGPFTGWHAIGLAFVAYATVHAFFTPTPYASVFGLWLVWIMALSVWFGTTLKDLRPLYAGLAVGAAVSSALAVLQYFGVAFPEYIPPKPAGLYANSVHNATVLALVFVALATQRMWLWALPLLPGILVSNSRGALVALAVGLLGCYFRRLWVPGAAAVAVALYLIFVPLSASDIERVLIWKTAWQGLTWFGWGPGVFYTIMLPKGDGWFYPETAHNDALQFAFEYGIAAALPFALFVFALRRTENSEWPVVLAFVTAGLYSMPLAMPVAAFLVLAAVGFGLRRHAVAGGYVDSGGQFVLPWRRAYRRRTVPVASHYSKEG